MLYFPILKGHFPAWMPIWGGEEFEFFKPIFNLADMAISSGVISMIVFQRMFFRKNEEQESENNNGSENFIAES
jgi:signal peptidase II